MKINIQPFPSNLDDLAISFVSALNPKLGSWTMGSAKKFLEHKRTRQPDLCLSVKYDDMIYVGGVCGEIIPWCNGNRLTNSILFIHKDYQNKNFILPKLLSLYFESAIKNYECKTMDSIAFNDESLLGLYRKIGITPDAGNVVVIGEIKDIIANLNKYSR